MKNADISCFTFTEYKNIFIKYENPIFLLPARLSVLQLRTDPESVVITGAVCWQRLMTGLWPVCFCLFGVQCSTVGYLPSWQCVLALGWVSGLERRPVLVLHQALCQLETRLLNLLLSSFLYFDSGAYSLVLELAASRSNTHVCSHLQGQQHPVATCLPGSHLSPKAAPTPKLKRHFCKSLLRD